MILGIAITVDETHLSDDADTQVLVQEMTKDAQGKFKAPASAS